MTAISGSSISGAQSPFAGLVSINPELLASATEQAKVELATNGSIDTSGMSDIEVRVNYIAHKMFNAMTGDPGRSTIASLNNELGKIVEAIATRNGMSLEASQTVIAPLNAGRDRVLGQMLSVVVSSRAKFAEHMLSNCTPNVIDQLFADQFDPNSLDCEAKMRVLMQKVTSIITDEVQREIISGEFAV